MNLSFFAVQNTDQRLNSQLTAMLTACSSLTPETTLRALAGASIAATDYVTYIGPTAYGTDVLLVKFPRGLLILLGGIKTKIQVGVLVGNWALPLPESNIVGGGNVFEAAAANVLAAIPSLYREADQDLFVAGHSFGGATAQVIGALARAQGGYRNIRIWSYGSPRPGNEELARRLVGMENTRFWVEGDPVPWLPPHTDEVPSMYLVGGVGLWRGCNSQVQAPSGYNIRSTGSVVPGMGSPSTNWGFTLDLAKFLWSDVSGIQNGNHALVVYNRFFLTGIIPTPIPVPVPTQLPQEPLVQTPRERAATIDLAESEWFDDATSPTGSTRTYVVPAVIDPSAPRYRAGRQGKAWVIRLGGEIVGAAKGKRNARAVARAWNRSARSTL